MTGLIAGFVALIAIMALRGIAVRRVETQDAARPRAENGIVRGAEGFVMEHAGAPAVLLLHGAGDTPQTLHRLGEWLHACGFAVAAPLLPGHGRSVQDFRRVSAEAWQDSAGAAYEDLRGRHSWVGVVGLSMGGALAARLVASRPETPALVLLAPYLGLPRTLSIMAAIAPLAGVVSPYFSSHDSRSVRDLEAAAEGLAYGVFTPSALRALRHVAAAGAAALPAIRTPTLIIQSRQDNRVSPAITERSLHRLGSPEKRLEWVSDGGHVITVDHGRERVFALTTNWLVSHGASSLLRS